MMNIMNYVFQLSKIIQRIYIVDAELINITKQFPVDLRVTTTINKVGVQKLYYQFEYLLYCHIWKCNWYGSVTPNVA